MMTNSKLSINKAALLVLIAVAIPVTDGRLIADEPQINSGSCYGSGARYVVSLSSSWKEADDVAPFGTEHWSPPVTWSHDGSPEGRIWQEGEIATAGIEEMAELGETGILQWELHALAKAGSVMDQKVVWNRDRYLGHFTPFAGRSWTITVDRAHPYSNTVSMVGPSPDWFLGVDMKMMDRDGSWLQSESIDLDNGYVWDAGTETGNDFILENADESPRMPITKLTARTLTGGAGSITYELVECIA